MGGGTLTLTELNIEYDLFIQSANTLLYFWNKNENICLEGTPNCSPQNNLTKLTELLKFLRLFIESTHRTQTSGIKPHQHT